MRERREPHRKQEASATMAAVALSPSPALARDAKPALSIELPASRAYRQQARRGGARRL